MKFDPKKTIAAVALAMAVAAPATPALAVTVAEGTPAGNVPVVQKTWSQLPAAVHALETNGFTLTYQGATDVVGEGTVTHNGATLAEGGKVPVTLSRAENSTAPVGIVTAATAFAGVDFSGPGIYTFELTEDPASDPLLYDYNTGNASYLVHVQVVWGDDPADGSAPSNPQVYSVTLENRTAGSEEGTKPEAGDFTNSAKDNASLELTKLVTGNQADSSQQFRFTVAFTGLEPGATYRYNNGEADATFTALGDGTAKVSDILLGHGQTAFFYNLNDGARYTVMEERTSPFAPEQSDVSVTTTSGEYRASITGNDGDLENNVQDVVTVTNTRNATTVTGLIVSSLPYIGGLAAAGVGAGLFVSARRRRKASDDF